MERRIAGVFLRESGPWSGMAVVRAGRIAALAPRSGRVDREFSEDVWLTPGFVDLHTHGIGREAFASAESALAGARLLGGLGVAAFYATSQSMPEAECARYLEGLETAARAAAAEREEWLASAGKGGAGRPPPARILGAHYEGPFINSERLGACSADSVRTPSAAGARAWLAAVGRAPAIMTWAPEVPGSLEAGRVLRDAGVALSIGHCLAGADDVRRGVELGAAMVTHLHNTWLRPGECEINPLMANALEEVWRTPGLFATVVSDLEHVAPDRLMKSFRAVGPDRFIAITDAMPGTGLPPGEYRTPDGRPYRSDGRAARLASGTLVGSVATMARAFANLLAVGFSPAEAAKATATNPARCMGFSGLGAVEVGRAADWAAVSAGEGAFLGSFHGGVWCEPITIA